MRALKIVLLSCAALSSLSSCAGRQVVTYSEFQEIHRNMTLGEAEKIIGHKGAELKGQTLYGALVAKPGEVVYYWQNKDGSNMTAATVNGRITDTSETDLH